MKRRVDGGLLETQCITDVFFNKQKIGIVWAGVNGKWNSATEPDKNGVCHYSKRQLKPKSVAVLNAYRLAKRRGVIGG